MQRSTRFALGLAGLVGMTLGLKLAFFTQTYATPDEAAFERDVARALAAHGFSTTSEAMLARHAIRARRKGCEVLVARIDSRGHGQDRFAIAARGLGDVRYLYRNEATAEFPRIRPLLEEQRWRFLQPLTDDARLAPVMALATAGSCRDIAGALADITVRPAAR